MRRIGLYVLSFIIISSLMASCVSKKKYDDLARAKRDVERNLLDVKKDKKNLEKESQQAKDDFNTIRYKLTENNAMKDKSIDELHNKLRTLESKQSALKSELDEASDQIKYSSESTEQRITTLESSFKKVMTERDELTRAKSELERENLRIKNELNTAQSGTRTKDDELLKLKQENEELEKKLAWIRKEKSNSDAEVKKLTSQINQLKKGANK